MRLQCQYLALSWHLSWQQECTLVISVYSLKGETARVTEHNHTVITFILSLLEAQSLYWMSCRSSNWFLSSRRSGRERIMICWRGIVITSARNLLKGWVSPAFLVSWCRNVLSAICSGAPSWASGASMPTVAVGQDMAEDFSNYCYKAAYLIFGNMPATLRAAVSCICLWSQDHAWMKPYHNWALRLVLVQAGSIG